MDTNNIKYISFRDYSSVAVDKGDNPSEVGYLKYIEKHSPDLYEGIAKATVMLQGGIDESKTNRDTKE